MLRFAWPLVLGVLAVSTQAQVLSYEKSLPVSGLVPAFANCFAQDSAGNVYIGGQMQYPSVEKVSPTGKVLWINSESSPSNALQILVNSTGQVYFITNYSARAVSPSGKTLWSVPIYAIFSSAATVNPSGNLVVAQSAPSVLTDFSASNGSTLWSAAPTVGSKTVQVTQLVGGPSALYGIAPSPIGSYAVDFSAVNGSTLWATLVTLDYPAPTNGWSFVAQTTYPQPTQLVPLSNGALEVVSQTTASFNWNPAITAPIATLDTLNAASGAFLSRTAPLPQKLNGVPAPSFSLSLAIDAGGNSYWATTPSSGSRLVVEKLDPSRNVIWQSPIPLGASNIEIAPAPSGGAAVTYQLAGISEPVVELINAGGGLAWTVDSAAEVPIPFTNSGQTSGLFAGSTSVTIAGTTTFGPDDSGFGEATFGASPYMSLGSSVNTVDGRINSALTGAVMDASGCSYALQTTRNGETLEKFSPGGTLMWSTLIGSGATAWIGSATLAYSSAGRVVVAVQTSSSVGLAEFSSASGTQIWGEFLTVPNGIVQAGGLAIDASGNPVCSYWYSTNSERVVSKFSALNGSMAWHNGAFGAPATSLVVDHSNQIFVSYPNATTSTNDEVASLSPSGISTWTAPFDPGLASNSAVLWPDGAGGVFAAAAQPGQITSVHFGATGSALWSRIVPTVSGPPDGPLHLAFDSAHGNLAISQEADAPTGDFIETVLLAGGTGVSSWLDQFGAGLPDSYVSGLTFDASGNVLITGKQYPLGVFVRRLAEQQGSGETYSYTGHLDAADASSVMVGPDGCAVVTGSTWTGLVYADLLFKLRY